MTAKPGTNRAEYFRKTLLIFSVGAQFVSTSLCLAIVLKVSVLLSGFMTPPSLPIKINFMKSDR